MLLPPLKAPLMAQPGYVQTLRPAGLDEQQCSGSALSRMECEHYDAKFRSRFAQMQFCRFRLANGCRWALV